MAASWELMFILLLFICTRWTTSLILVFYVTGTRRDHWMILGDLNIWVWNQQGHVQFKSASEVFQMSCYPERHSAAGCLENGGFHNVHFLAARCAWASDCSFSPPTRKVQYLGVDSEAHYERKFATTKDISERYPKQGPGLQLRTSDQRLTGGASVDKSGTT